MREQRDKLYREGKPTIREYNPQDIKWLWAAVCRAGTSMPRENFIQIINHTLAKADMLWVIEDRNSEFQTGFGPVCLVLATHDGSTLEPNVEWFPWATPRNKLRCTVGFLQHARYMKGTVIIRILTTYDLQKLKHYIPIGYAGKIPSSVNIYYLRGKDYASLDTDSSRNSRSSVESDGSRQRGDSEFGADTAEFVPHYDPALSSGNSADRDRHIQH